MVPEPHIVEIRVHGVGDQSGYRALGEPSGTALNGWVERRSPPALPAHPLKLINWWRANRKQTSRIWWYLAFPFTLINVAGRMRPEEGHPVALNMHRAVVSITAVGTTLVQLAWLIVLMETILRYLPLFMDPLWLGRLTPLAAAAGLSLLLILCWVRVVRLQPEDAGTSKGSLCSHVAVVLAGGILLSALRPGQTAYDGWPSVVPPGPGNEPLLDAMALVVVVSTTGVMLLASLLVAVYAFTPSQGRKGVRPLPMTGLVLTVAVVLMHTVTALVRMALDNLTNYVNSLLYPLQSGALPYQYRVLLSYDDPAVAGDSRLDLLPFQSMILLLGLFAVTFLVLGLCTKLKLSNLFRGAYSRGVWWHDFIGVLPSVVPLVTPIAGLLGMVGVAAAVILGEGKLGGPIFGLGVLLLQVAAAVVILSMLLGQFPAFREVMAKIGDLAGFWPVRDHPLAGTSYRYPVLAGIRLELDQCGEAVRPILFGHSQGSVLCAWLLAHEPHRSGPQPVFVSAGSPIESVYAPLFPAYFTSGLQVRVAGATEEWINFWRETDPLGGPIDGAENLCLADSLTDPLRHGGYWEHPRIAVVISRFEPGTEVFPPNTNCI